MFWTEEMDNLLRELAAIVGMSCGMIAVEFQPRLGMMVTRNAVIGRAARLGIKTQPIVAEKNDPEQQPRRDRLPLVKAPDQPAPVLRSDPVVPQRLKHLIELEPHECRWPIGGWPDNTPVLFCAKSRRKDSPYCPGHTNLGTQRQS